MGNIRARKRVNKVKKDLVPMGIEPERVEMFNLSSSEGPKFANVAREMVARTLKLGPCPRNPRNAPPGGQPTPSCRRLMIGGEGQGLFHKALSPSPNPISRGDLLGRPEL